MQSDKNPEVENERIEETESLPETKPETGGEEEEAALKERLEQAERERDEYLGLAQRIQAEFENFRKRNNAVRSEAWDDGARETIAMMLPVIDNLERALDTTKEKSPLKDGVEMVLKQMLEVLDKRGVTVIDRLGEPFDPELENAVMQADPSEGEPGTVCTVLLKGYRTPTRVIRHAMVCVVAAE